MSALVLVLIGLAGGVMAGYGLGGGTLLIPLVTMLTGTDQHVAQAINLVAFVPTSVVALVVHAKNGLVEKRRLPLAIPAAAASVGAARLASTLSGEALGRWFGAFLLAVGAGQFIACIAAKVKKNRARRNKKRNNLPE